MQPANKLQLPRRRLTPAAPPHPASSLPTEASWATSSWPPSLLCSSWACLGLGKPSPSTAVAAARHRLTVSPLSLRQSATAAPEKARGGSRSASARADARASPRGDLEVSPVDKKGGAALAPSEDYADGITGDDDEDDELDDARGVAPPASLDDDDADADGADDRDDYGDGGDDDGEEPPPDVEVSSPPLSGAVSGSSGAAPSGLADPAVRAALLKLKDCRSYSCLQEVHAVTRGRTAFNFPHFFLIGWQKCATTSINHHLRAHPQFLPGVRKEPHWFSVCEQGATKRANTSCLAWNITQYFKDYLRIDDAAVGGLTAATLDASVDYAWRGSLAKELAALFPWAKIVMVMREPLSRLISYTRMYQRESSTGGCAIIDYL